MPHGLPAMGHSAPAASHRRSFTGRRVGLGMGLSAWLLAAGVLVASPYVVQKTSMAPSLVPGEVLFVDRVSPLVLGYERGDVVVFNAPDGRGVFVKRVVGLPGEDVLVTSDGVTVDGHRLDEPYAAAGRAGSRERRFVVPAGSYLLLGDNRPVSLDSRAFGPVRADRLLGRAWAGYVPPIGVQLLPPQRAFAAEP